MMGFALAAPSGGWDGGVGFILRAGFGQAPLIKALLMGWWLAAMFIMVFWLVSGQFSASWAAQETKETDQMKSLSRYGFAHQVREMRVKNRLRLRDQVIWAPAWEGSAGIVWKDLLQYWRSFSWDDFFELVVLISSMMGLILLPTLSSRFFVVVFWAMRTGKITTARLQNDLSRWMIIKQLPLDCNQWIPADLTSTSILVGLASLIGMILGSLQVRRFPPVEAVLLPGMIASVAGMAGFDLMRKARADLLLRGVSPQVSELAIIGSALCAGVPVSLTALVAGWPGVLIGYSASILIAGLMLSLAVNALRYNAQV
ncbi:MAG: hypothetical protein GX142_02725 [Chloroflexi bacterium]|nr:hypothetical protein [Chloroflexota bacterium]